MKKFRSFISVVLIFCFAMLFTSSAFASTTVEDMATPILENNATARGVIAQCPSCGSSLYEYQIQWGGWYYWTERKCTEKPYGTDLGEQRKGAATVKCVRCAYGYTKDYWESRWTCHGYYS